ncbi:hypothetical protein FKM82_015179 [Ascaphus truei]
MFLFRKVIYACAAVCAILTVQGHAQRSVQLPSVDPNNLDAVQEGCKEGDGTEHKYGETWTKHCYECSCREPGFIICSRSVATPVGYDKELCKKKFDEKSCSFSVVKKHNPLEICEVVEYIA